MINNTKSRPYVYLCTHKETGQFYIGYRYANTVPAISDLGIHYFTSSYIVSNDFSNYNYEILSEYDSTLMAFEVEQVVIYENRNNPLLINKNYKTKNHITLDPKPAALKISDNSYKERTAILKKLPTTGVSIQRKKSQKIIKSEDKILPNAAFEQYISIYKKIKSNKIDSRVRKFFKKKKIDINIYINNPELLEYKI